MADETRKTDRLTTSRFVLNDLLTNGFVVRDEGSGELAIIDPGDRADTLLEATQELGGDVRWILVTHLHGDHYAEVGKVAAATGAKVVAPEGAPFPVDQVVRGGESIEFGESMIEVAATPGHSPESVTFLIDDHVFVGDFLFRLGSGRTDGAGSSTADLFATVGRVFKDLPAESILWCGHGPPSTVGEERDGNPFWRLALSGETTAPVDKVQYQGLVVPVLIWADDYDGGTKALLELADGAQVIVPGSQVTRLT